MQVYDILLDCTKKETTQHGSFGFPLAIYTTQIQKNVLGFINWHWHQELQFCIVTQGTVEFHVNQTKLVLAEGDGIFVNAGHIPNR